MTAISSASLATSRVHDIEQIRRPDEASKMPVDRLLSTLLRSLQTYTDQQDTPRYAPRP